MLPEDPGSSELRIPGAAAQTRLVSMSGIRLFRRKSTQSFKGIICDDISEFESSTPATQSGLECNPSRRHDFFRITFIVAASVTLLKHLEKFGAPAIAS